MVRKQILMTDELEDALVERANVLGVSQGELVRQLLEESLLGAQARRQAAQQSVLAAMGAALRESARSPHAGPAREVRGWTRDDLYDEDDDEIV